MWQIPVLGSASILIDSHGNAANRERWVAPAKDTQTTQLAPNCLEDLELNPLKDAEHTYILFAGVFAFFFATPSDAHNSDSPPPLEL